MTKSSWLLFLVLVVGLITRSFQATSRFLYSHDNDLSSWIVKDIIIDRHFRLIGQLTTAPGVFIGPFFYYSLIPFYLVSRLDPIGVLGWSGLVSLLSLASFYWVLKKVYDTPTAAIGSFLYAASFSISQTEREIVPTTPVMLWSIWFFYSLNLLLAGRKRSLTYLAILFALVWHIHLALVLLLAVIAGAFFVRRKFYRVTDLILPLLIFLFLSAPLLVFEARHNFTQTRAITGSFFASKSESKFLPKLDQTITYAARNATKIFIPFPASDFPLLLVPGVCLFLLGWSVFLRRLPKVFLLLVPVWLLVYLLFFSLHSIPLSEYYLNGLNLLWLLPPAIVAGTFVHLPAVRMAVGIFLAVFLGYHLNIFFSSTINHSGYIEKKAIVAAIAADSRLRGYPCISVSFITRPGYQFGYRYFFWLTGLHVNLPKSGSPVYTIVFPHSLVDRLDATYGALGLILPDYGRYEPGQVKDSCQGPASFITDSMFGFTN